LDCPLSEKPNFSARLDKEATPGKPGAAYQIAELFRQARRHYASLFNIPSDAD
jgi:hypothetical protein